MKLIPLGLNARKHKGYFAKVDDEDYEELMKYSWYASYASRIGGFYANRGKKIGGRSFSIAMHRQIMSAPEGMDVDHINHDTLDNRRSNLRLCLRGENNGNSRKRGKFSSRYKGVSRKKTERLWRASIQQGPRNVHLGRFESEEEAARVYDAAALEYFGEFALLNFPDS
jgi:hypothetical protein